MPTQLPPATGRTSPDLAVRAARVMPGGANSNFRLASATRFWASGSGSRLTDVDGNEFIDFALGMGTAILGHSPRTVLDRVAAAQGLLQCPAGQQEAEVELAERIVDLVPSAERVRIGCTGTEMVQLALRVARAVTGRSLVVKFEGHYHGWLDSVFSGTTQLPAEGSVAAVPQTGGQSAAALADLAVLPWNDLGVLEGFLAVRGGEVAALIMEPVLCNTSVIVPRDGYLQAARELCDRHGVVLIFDEVITGFRLHQGGAQARLGVTPDLTVLGKALGAGFPIAALAGRAALMGSIGGGSVMHGGTYNANAPAVAAALAALGEMADPGQQFYSRLEAVGRRLADGLAGAARRAGGTMSVAAAGPVVNTTFSPPQPIVDFRTYQASDLDRQRSFIESLEAEGVRLTSRGTWFVSSAHTDQDIDLTLAAVDRALRGLQP
ncbi:MAG: aspartate aminotransferase family protein [Streptosporangiaceae bacterium]